MELLHRKQELEQAELEWAVAISLALEEERLRLMYADAKDVDAAEDAADTKVRFAVPVHRYLCLFRLLLQRSS